MEALKLPIFTSKFQDIHLFSENILLHYNSAVTKVNLHFLQHRVVSYERGDVKDVRMQINYMPLIYVTNLTTEAALRSIF